VPQESSPRKPSGCSLTYVDWPQETQKDTAKQPHPCQKHRLSIVEMVGDWRGDFLRFFVFLAASSAENGSPWMIWVTSTFGILPEPVCRAWCLGDGCHGLWAAGRI